MLSKKYVLILIFLNLLFISGCSSNRQQTYVDYVGNYQSDDEFVKAFYNSILIDIKNIQTELERGTVDVTIPDLEAIYKAHYDEFVSGQKEEDIQNIILENIDEYVIKVSIDTDLVKDGNAWKVGSTEQIDEEISTMIDNFLLLVFSDMQFEDISIDTCLEEIQ